MEDDIWKTIRNLNDTWTKAQNLEDIRSYFHDEAVALTGRNRERIEGGDACAEHWINCSKSNIHLWEEINPIIRIYSDKFAVVSYEFNITLDRGGETVSSTSRDSFSLTKEDDRWLIVLATV